jgi:hypothetical protein
VVVTEHRCQRVRRAFFGGVTAPGVTTFDTLWAARFRLASTALSAYALAQALEAAGRFDRILREVGNLNVAGVNRPLDVVISSRHGVALILDQHINRPASVPGDLQAAINAVVPQPDADALDRAVTNRYAQIRQLQDAAQRTARIVAVALDRGHGSFGGWRGRWRCASGSSSPCSARPSGSPAACSPPCTRALRCGSICTCTRRTRRRLRHVPSWPAARRSRSMLHAHGRNRGLSRTWNDGLLAGYADGADVVIITNDYVRFGPGDLDRLAQAAADQRDRYIVSCAGPHGRYGQRMPSHGFSCFAINPIALGVIGCFDENIFPRTARIRTTADAPGSLGSTKPTAPTRRSSTWEARRSSPMTGCGCGTRTARR